jgi:hypothetical protein
VLVTGNQGGGWVSDEINQKGGWKSYTPLSGESMPPEFAAVVRSSSKPII